MSKKQSNLENLMKPVKLVKSVELFPGFSFTKQNEFSVVVDNNGDDLIVNQVSKVYHLVKNEDIIKPLQKLFSGMEFEITGKQRFDSRFYFDFIFKDKNLAIMDGDLIFPKLRVNNSYDGRVKYSMDMGFYRLICSNGLVVPIKGFEDKNIKIKMRHTPSLGAKFENEPIEEMVSDFLDSYTNYVKPFKELSKKKINNLEDTINDVIENTKFSSRKAEEVFNIIIEEQGRLKAKTPNAWLLYSGFNNVLNHGGMERDFHKVQMLDQQILTYIQDAI